VTSPGAHQQGSKPKLLSVQWSQPQCKFIFAHTSGTIVLTWFCNTLDPKALEEEVRPLHRHSLSPPQPMSPFQYFFRVLPISRLHWNKFLGSFCTLSVNFTFSSFSSLKNTPVVWISATLMQSCRILQSMKSQEKHNSHREITPRCQSSCDSCANLIRNFIKRYHFVTSKCDALPKCACALLDSYRRSGLCLTSCLKCSVSRSASQPSPVLPATDSGQALASSEAGAA